MRLNLIIQMKGVICLVNLSDENEFVVIEGDEYYSSAIDSKSKFFWYKPRKMSHMWQMMEMHFRSEDVAIVQNI